jgi:hypothetical protein
VVDESKFGSNVSLQGKLLQPFSRNVYSIGIVRNCNTATGSYLFKEILIIRETFVLSIQSVENRRPVPIYLKENCFVS